ncbi:MAG: hypothetical protein ACRD2T_12575 [Thermoanaerobaculia bacterium]
MVDEMLATRLREVERYYRYHPADPYYYGPTVGFRYGFWWP